MTPSTAGLRRARGGWVGGKVASACAGWAILGATSGHAACPEVGPELGAIERNIADDFTLDARRDLAAVAKALVCDPTEPPPPEVLARLFAAQAALHLIAEGDHEGVLVALASARRVSPAYQPAPYGPILATWWRLAVGEVDASDWPEGYDEALDRWWREARAAQAVPVPISFRNVGCRWVAVDGERVVRGGKVVGDEPLTRTPGVYLVQAGGGGLADYAEFVRMDGTPVRLHATSFQECQPIGVLFKNVGRREVFVDNQPVADLGVPYPLQPGEYTLEARRIGSAEPNFSSILSVSPADETPKVVPLTALASRRKVLLSAGVGLGAAAVAAYGAGWATHYAFMRPPYGQRDLGLGIAQHGLVVGSGGLLAASSACLIWGFATKRVHPWELSTTN